MLNYPLIKRLQKLQGGQFNLIGTVIKVKFSEQNSLLLDPGPQRTPILPTRREFAGNPKFLHYVDAKIT